MITSMGAALREPLLGVQEERDAIRRWQAGGDRGALEVLLRSHARQVWAQARRRTDNPAHLDDLVAEGMIGLIRAVENFDLDRGVRFATYARWWVRNEVNEALRRVRAVIDMPQRGSAEADSGARASAVCGSVAFEAVAGEDGLSLLERMPSEELSPEEEMLRRSSEGALKEALDAALADLPEVEVQIVLRRRLAVTPDSVAAVAADLGLREARVRQLETHALQRLRQRLLSHGFCLSMLH